MKGAERGNGFYAEDNPGSNVMLRGMDVVLAGNPREMSGALRLLVSATIMRP